MRDLKLQVRLDDAEMSLLQEAARRAHKTPSEWARTILLMAAGTAIREGEDRAADVANKTAQAFGTADIWGKKDDRP